MSLKRKTIFLLVISFFVLLTAGMSHGIVVAQEPSESSSDQGFSGFSESDYNYDPPAPAPPESNATENPNYTQNGWELGYTAPEPIDSARLEVADAAAQKDTASAKLDIANAEVKAKDDKEAADYLREAEANRVLVEAKNTEDVTNKVSVEEAEAKAKEAADAREASSRALNDADNRANAAADELVKAEERFANAHNDLKAQELAQPSLPKTVGDEKLLQPVGLPLLLVGPVINFVLDGLGINPLTHGLNALSDTVGAPHVPTLYDTAKNIFSGSSQAPVAPVPPVSPVPPVESSITWTGPRVEPQPSTDSSQAGTITADRIEHSREAQGTARQVVDDARAKMTEAEINLRNTIVSKESSPEELSAALDRVAEARADMTRANGLAYDATRNFLEVLQQSVGQFAERPPLLTSDERSRSESSLDPTNAPSRFPNTPQSLPPELAQPVLSPELQGYIRGASSGLTPQGTFIPPPQPSPLEQYLQIYTTGLTPQGTSISPPSPPSPPSPSSPSRSNAGETGRGSEDSTQNTSPQPSVLSPSVSIANIVNNSDGSVTTTYSNGVISTLYRDHTRIEIRPDGTTLSVGVDGSVTVRPTAVGFYELYVNGGLVFSKEGTTRERALSHCLATESANPSASSIRCTWNGGEIYNKSTTATAPVLTPFSAPATPVGFYEVSVNGGIVFSKEGATRDTALSHCLAMVGANPSASSIRCIWNGIEIYSKGTAVTLPVSLVPGTNANHGLSFLSALFQALK